MASSAPMTAAAIHGARSAVSRPFHRSTTVTITPPIAVPIGIMPQAKKR